MKSIIREELKSNILRLAFDFISEDKWNNIVKSPFLNNCKIHDFVNLGIILNIYKSNKDILLLHNKKSLNYRNGKDKRISNE
jgi:hypothetical protein